MVEHLRRRVGKNREQQFIEIWPAAEYLHDVMHYDRCICCPSVSLSISLKRRRSALGAAWRTLAASRGAFHVLFECKKLRSASLMAAEDAAAYISDIHQSSALQCIIQVGSRALHMGKPQVAITFFNAKAITAGLGVHARAVARAIQPPGSPFANHRPWRRRQQRACRISRVLRTPSRRSLFRLTSEA